MKYALPIVLTIGLAGCVGPQHAGNNHPQHELGGVASWGTSPIGNFDEEARELERRQKAGEITQLQLSQALFDAQQRLIPEESAYGAYLAYRVLAAQQLDEGKISVAEFQAQNQALFAAYQERQRQAQAEEQARYDAHMQAQAAMRGAAGAQFLNNIGNGFRNAYQPLPRASVNCISSPLGGSVSTTCY